MKAGIRGSGFRVLYEMRDAKNNHRNYGMKQKLGSERRDNRTLLGTLYLDMFYVMGALPMLTWVVTHGRAARGSPTSTYINTLLRDTGAMWDTGLENVRDRESCIRNERSSLMESVFIPSSSKRRPKERSNDFVK